VIRHTVERDFIVQMYAGLTNHPESCTYSDAVIMAVIGMETSQFSTRVYTQMEIQYVVYLLVYPS